MSVKKDIVDELHRPARKNFERRRVIVKGLNDLLQCDLVEMIPYAKVNKGYRYILVAINVFSKYVWAIPVKRKTAADVADALNKIFKTFIPKNLHTDMGKEFHNKSVKDLLDKHNINHYNTYSTMKACVVERVNRSLKTLMWKHFSLQGNYKWLSLLPKVVKKYNETKHRTTGFKPIDVKKSNEKKILRDSYSFIKTVDVRKPQFQVGDKVRISKHREAFSKGYRPNWSTEIFTVAKIKETNPRHYMLKDEKDEEIIGGFYTHELQLVKHKDAYLVERILQRKGSNILAKWLGIKQPSWINKKNIVI